jgi:hypothetical protein
MSRLTTFAFEIEAGPEIPEDQRTPISPEAELVPFIPRPVTESEVLGRRIDWINPYFGTYGMGGPGFFALTFGEQCLVIALWGAGNWLRFNGRSVEANPGEEVDAWDLRALEEAMVGQTIAGLAVGRAAMTLTLSGGGVLRIDEAPGSREVFPGTGEARAFAEDDDLRRVVFLAPNSPLWI